MPLDLGTPKQRSLVAALALSAGRPVSVDTLVDLLWGDHAPSTVTGTLQAYVSVLRRTLEPHRAKRAPAEVLVTVAPGYALRLPDGALDARAFDQVVTEEHRRLSGPLLGPSPLPRDGLEAGVARLGEALDLWRGTPYADLDDAPAVVAERAHLDELRLVALEDRAVARLALGDHGTTAADLEALTTAHPLRERLWALRALALVRSGRQADALEVLRTVREVLADEPRARPGRGAARPPGPGAAAGPGARVRRARGLGAVDPGRSRPRWPARRTGHRPDRDAAEPRRSRVALAAARAGRRAPCPARCTDRRTPGATGLRRAHR